MSSPRLRERCDIDAFVASASIPMATQRIGFHTGHWTGQELLLRWDGRGPGGILAAATSRGAGHRVDARIIAEGAELLATGRIPDLQVSINVGVESMDAPRFAETVLGLWTDRGHAPSTLTLEISEAGSLEERRRAVLQLCELQAAGIRLAIDDFGIGHNHLHIIDRVGFDVIKLDQSLVRAACADAPGAARARRLLKGLVGMIRDLGATPVIEGVERLEEARLLLELGVPGQGFLIDAPRLVLP